MHVALFSDWFAPRRGGIESHLLHLGRALGVLGHRVSAITAQPGAQDIHPGLQVLPLACRHLPVVDLALPCGLTAAAERRLRQAAPDIVHVHASIVAPACVAGIRAALRLGLPVVVTFHSDLRQFRPLLALLAPWRDRVAFTAVSAPIARQIGALAWPGGAVLPNGFDRAFWSASVTAPVTGPAGPPPHGAEFRIVSAMRLVRKKRPLVLPRIAERVAAATGRPVRLIIAGDGGAAMKRALSGQADLPGWLAREDLRALYRGADVFIQPTRHESFGIAAIEARAAGLPVIGRAGTGLADFIATGKDGFLCADDAGLMAAAIRLAADPALAGRMAGPRPDLARFDWPEVAARHVALYESVTRARKSGSISRTSRG